MRTVVQNRSTTPAPIPGPGLGIPDLIPILMLDRGHVMTPAPDGPVRAHGEFGKPRDVFETIDELAASSPRVYIMDLAGIEHGNPELDYLQELSRGVELWVDAGAQDGGDVADLLVAGATRVTMSTSRIRSAKEIARAFQLSPQLMFEIEIRAGGVSSRPRGWSGLAPLSVWEEVRTIGLRDLILSPRETSVDWSMVRQLSGAGSVWVDGSFEQTDAAKLKVAGCRGGFYHPDLSISSER